MTFIVNNNETKIRLDIFLQNELNKTRSYISNIIKNKYVLVNDIVATKSGLMLKENDKIEVLQVEEKKLDLTPENIPLDIVYEDDDILVINKQRGVVVHPSNGHPNGTIVNAVLNHCKNNLSSINGIIRPGIVHRIDKDTSGLLCICKNDISHNNISEQFKEHTNVRKYKTIVKGIIKNDEGTITTFINRDKKNRLRMAVAENGKLAITKYKILKRYNNYTYVECNLLTGRTHQIRVHMKHIGHPILGDLVYGSVDKKFKYLNGQILHAYYMSFKHPTTKKNMIFETDVPEYFKECLYKLDNE